MSIRRTVHDIRTVRNIPSVRAGRDTEPALYVRMSRLASEKERLQGEYDNWQRKIEQITKRLGDIDAELDQSSRQLSSIPAEQGSRSAKRLWREIDLRY